MEAIWRNAVIYLQRDNFARINLSRLPGIGHIRNEDRYLKRPPVAASKLRHYRGGAVVHQYYDHRTQQHKRQKLGQEEMLQRYVSHISARHFKMVRYYGFLANRKRGTLLPKVYDTLEMTVREKPKRPGFAVLMKGFLGTDPYQCIPCKGRLHRMAKKRWLQTPLLEQYA
ncbi:transposase [Serratia ficaria]|uniref:transposase n=1 Tax=Serratia ficaria TaxID=61651 RepID=UPI000A3F1ED1|nr:transposase [Serratia ficaria]